MNEQSATEANTHNKIAIQTAIDAAENASQMCKSAREAFHKFAVACASAAEEIEEFGLCADKAFDVYAQAHANALETASVSHAAIAEFEASLRLRCARLGVEMYPPSGEPRLAPTNLAVEPTLWEHE